MEKSIEKLNFDRKCKCDFCGQEEICAITTYGTTNYNRVICVECAMSINCSHEIPLNGRPWFDLNNSIIRFRNFANEDSERE